MNYEESGMRNKQQTICEVVSFSTKNQEPRTNNKQQTTNNRQQTTII